ncbi:serine/threonine protein kinase [Methylomonas sp. LWB]|uniref:serine/threonine-protein kinase n=1 Tax=Methylomonas sp. LWB TaxID=1905845 RepID=UPI0008D9B745|nr:serine/threonine-protein kinase [Methylomonas sp. LWB]OHX37793.1 serine/threonine protein kinase [Methylomonas sp. LWB]
MSAFDNAFTAFRQSQISLAQLLAAAEALNAGPEADLAAARLSLEQALAEGELEGATYRLLVGIWDDRTRLAESTSTPPTAADDATLVAMPADGRKLAEAKKPEAGDDPMWVATAAGDGDATELLNPAATADATRVGETVVPEAAPASTTKTPTLNTESLLQGLDPSLPRTDLVVGDTVKKRFVLEELLGVGGMGMVFKATDLRKVEAADKDPFVALKVLNRDFQFNPMALVALQRETKRAQTLAHPNIIKVYDFDRDDAGHVFMTMEYLQGRPLSHLIRDHVDSGLPFKKAWPIIHAMAEALGYAHKKKIVHSDFKPGNVFLGDDGEIRVLDFGIACAIGRSEAGGDDATVFNARDLGALTPAYASLEQLQNRDPDPRDDIYALACISYELLTGKHPFGKLSAEKVLEVNLQPKAIPKLGRRQWKGLQKALALRQDKRTATIREFLAALAPRSAAFFALWGAAVLVALSGGFSIYWRLAHPPGETVPQVAIKALTPEEVQKIQDLQELAAIHLDVGYLTAPTGSNAWWAYQEILKIDPYNQVAVDGINKIADLLEQQAWELYEKGQRAEALKKVGEGLEVNPGHKGLLSLQDKLRS